MAQFTVNELSHATGGVLRQGAESTPVFGVSTDSRKVREGDAFIALVGESFDGHAFVAQCLAKGVAGVIVSHAVDVAVPQHAFFLEVENTLYALQDIARFHRQRYDIPVIGVTGSNGKTTTKDMIAAVLVQRFTTLKTQANFNNEIGLPLTLLGLNDEHQAAVVEMGMRGLGEIRELADIALPNLAVVTNVSETHMELLGSIGNIARAKAELVESLSDNGIAFLNSDDILVKSMADRCRGDVVFYGTGVDADVRAVDIVSLGECGTRATVRAGDKTFSVTIPVPGRHNVVNALAAIAVGLRLGMTEEEIRQGLAQFSPSAMRLDIRTTKQGYKVINDVYNASPLSMRAALDTLCDIATNRKIAVLGDMLELGSISEQAHREVGEYAARRGIACVLTLGGQAQFIAEGARKFGSKLDCIESFMELETLINRLIEVARPGDIILVKGSRGMRMERVAAALDEI
jgi:UDP-N-acetylmuramoyl-tripeptide--D-alanyl-D-alanine ligase